jgi:hypothetical protein
MRHRIIDVAIGVWIGIGLTYALTAHAQTLIYVAPVEEKEIIQIREESIEEKILKKFPDAPIMLEVARCESGLQNIPGQLSDDSGIFQINVVHTETLQELGLDRTNIDDNIAFARILYDQSGLQPWKNSEHCWNKAP